MPKDPADPHNLASVVEAAAETILIATEGPDPEAHARQIEELLRGRQGVISVRADPENARVIVTFDHLEISAPDLHDLILEGGYQPSPGTPLDGPPPPDLETNSLEDDALPLTPQEFSEYVGFHASRCTAGEIDELAARLPELRKQFAQVQNDKLPKAPAQFSLLADVVEAFKAGAEKEVPFNLVAEAAVALNYLERQTDLIPDSLPEIGYLDDAAIVQTVFARNAEALNVFAAGRDVEWESVRAD